MERKISVKKISTKILCGFMCVLLIFTVVMADVREAKAVAIVDDFAFWAFILAVGGVAIVQSNVVEGWFDDVADGLTQAIDGNLALQLFPDPDDDDDDKGEEPEKDEYDRIEKDGKEEWTTVEGMKKYIDTTGQSITLTAITTLAIVQGVAEYFSKHKSNDNAVSLDNGQSIIYDAVPDFVPYKYNDGKTWNDSKQAKFDDVYATYYDLVASGKSCFVSVDDASAPSSATKMSMYFAGADEPDDVYLITDGDYVSLVDALGSDWDTTWASSARRGCDDYYFDNYEGAWSSYRCSVGHSVGKTVQIFMRSSIYLSGDNVFFWDGASWISSKGKARVIEGDPIQGPQLAPETTTQPTYNPNKNADYAEKLKELDDKINEIKQNTDPAKQNEAIQEAVNAYLKDIQDDAKKETDKIVNPDPDPTPNPDPDPDPDPGTTETPDKDDAPDQGKEPELPELTWHDLALDLENVFPFCIPWDFYKLLCALFVPAKAFEIHESIDLGSLHLGRYDIDCNQYNDFVRILRLFQEIFYLGILMRASRRIKGGS